MAPPSSTARLPRTTMFWNRTEASVMKMAPPCVARQSSASRAVGSAWQFSIESRFSSRSVLAAPPRVL
eukprot:SAG22_NODE_375_length_11547_cov_12.885657_8_plen_68_part_00